MMPTPAEQMREAKRIIRAAFGEYSCVIKPKLTEAEIAEFERNFAVDARKFLALDHPLEPGVTDAIGLLSLIKLYWAAKIPDRIFADIITDMIPEIDAALAQPRSALLSGPRPDELDAVQKRNAKLREALESVRCALIYNGYEHPLVIIRVALSADSAAGEELPQTHKITPEAQRDFAWSIAQQLSDEAYPAEAIMSQHGDFLRAIARLGKPAPAPLGDEGLRTIVEQIAMAEIPLGHIKPKDLALAEYIVSLTKGHLLQALSHHPLPAATGTGWTKYHRWESTRRNQVCSDCGISQLRDGDYTDEAKRPCPKSPPTLRPGLTTPAMKLSTKEKS